MSKNAKTLIAVSVLVLLIIGFCAAYFYLRPEAAEGDKTVAIAVTHGDGTVKEFTLHSYAKTLREAMDELGIVEGEDGPYGIFVTAVDGEAVDAGAEEWWCFTKGGEMLMTGLDDTVIADGEHYEAVFTVGYDFF